MILRHSFTPPNNARLAHLCGPMDANLRRIEEALDVKIAHRHEVFKVDGHKAKATRAMETLQALYEIAQRPIDASMVQLTLAGDSHMAEDADGALVLNTRRNDLRARTPNQSVYLQNIADTDITFGIGPAGTGKTYLAMAAAVSALLKNEVQRIILTRPAVEAGEALGFLPGDLREKILPYLRPLYDALHDMLDPEDVARLTEKGVIEIAPLAYMRGRTLANAFIILDEAQNTTPEQMMMFLTRLGEESRMVVTGDITQIDLPRSKQSGLMEVRHILGQVPGIDFHTFSGADVVRHPLVAQIIAAYERYKDPVGNSSTDTDPKR